MRVPDRGGTPASRHRAAFERVHAIDAIYAASDKESKAAWKDKNMSRVERNKSRGEKQDGQAMQSADAKWKETMEAVKEFNEARARQKGHKAVRLKLFQPESTLKLEHVCRAALS